MRFSLMLDNFELIMYMKFQKLLITGCSDMDKKHQKYPQKWCFSPIYDPPTFFFQKSGSVTFLPSWCPNFMQTIRKKQWRVFEIFKDKPQTNGRTNRQWWLLRTRQKNPGSKKSMSLVSEKRFILSPSLFQINYLS